MATLAVPAQPHKTRSMLSQGALYFIAVMLAVVFLFPIVWTMTSSLKPPA